MTHHQKKNLSLVWRINKIFRVKGESCFGLSDSKKTLQTLSKFEEGWQNLLLLKLNQRLVYIPLEKEQKLKTTGNIKISHTPLHKTNKINSFTH